MVRGSRPQREWWWFRWGACESSALGCGGGGHPSWPFQCIRGVEVHGRDCGLGVVHVGVRKGGGEGWQGLQFRSVLLKVGPEDWHSRGGPRAELLEDALSLPEGAEA